MREILLLKSSKKHTSGKSQMKEERCISSIQLMGLWAQE